MPGHQDDGNGASFCEKSLVQFDAVQAGHADIGHQAPGLLRIVIFEKVLGARVGDDRMRNSFQQTSHRSAYGGVVIHDENGRPIPIAHLLHLRDSRAASL